ncbi:MAG: primosomal protein N', partial [Desulfobacterales bacterium]
EKVIDALKAQGELSMTELRALTPSAPRIVKTLAAAGQVQISEKPIYRDPFGEPITPDTPPILNREQAAAVSAVTACLGQGYTPFLLAGVTGSGKTEVYLRLAAETLAQKLSVIVLVPEIALISQAARRFRARFGQCVAVLHSGLTPGERRAQWRRIADGEIPIVIGARSAIFAPLAHLGLVVVDEEHDVSYKQESGLRYNARDLALVRARQQEAVALLGSATPSVQSYFNVQTEKFRELTLTRRVAQRAMPEINVVDLREIRDLRGIARFFSPQLTQALDQTLKRGEQALIFLNRRGFASFPICGYCGKPLSCPNCDISLTFHQKINAHSCHWCGFSQPAGLACPHCGALEIKNLGLGTERLESALAERFPQARIGRMDRDTTRQKGRLIEMLNDLKQRRIDILVGTQMVTKGHNFPHITLVGVICADMSLNIPDFRAGERTFQLLAQVAGRAGRGSAAGQVILQTYTPEHFTIRAAQAQDFQRFYHQEIVFRRSLNYPPFSHLIHLKISGRHARRTAERAGKIGRLCQKIKAERGEMENVEILGPIEAGIARIANRHRWQILLKASAVASLHRFAREVLFGHPIVSADREVRVTADVDPYLMG